MVYLDTKIKSGVNPEKINNLAIQVADQIKIAYK